MWIIAFLSPSLREICAVPLISRNTTRIPSIPPLLASLVLKKVTSQCPGLRKLSIFPDVDYSEQGGSPGPLFAYLSMSEPRFSHHIAGAQQLQEFISNEKILEGDVLVALASLPHLLHLEIYTDQIEDVPSSSTLPELSFPSLRQLTLHLSVNEGVEDLWTLPALQQLTSIRIEFRDQHDHDTESRKLWARSLLSTIADNSPNLKHLHMNFSSCNACGEEPCDLGDLSLFEDLGNLPLETVRLESVWFGPYDRIVYRRLARTWPQVTNLCIPAQPATLHQLPLFAQLPKLKHLTLDLMLSHPPTCNLAFSAHPAAPPLNTLEVVSTSTPTGNLVAIAR